MIHVNYAFVLDCATRHRAGGRVLDFGCGDAETVQAGLTRGLDIYGTDLFYDAAHDSRRALTERGLLGTRVLELVNNRIPFPDHQFDFVFHNQVIEHVEDIDHVLSEIGRVLKADGLMLSLFPSKETIMEAHCRVPYAHRFEHNSKMGLVYMRACRGLGIGTHHGGKTQEKWAREFLEWIYKWCHYRTQGELVDAYKRAGFSFERYEQSYVKFRLEYTKRAWLVPLVALSPRLASFAFWRLGGMVILSRRTQKEIAPSVASSLPT